MGGPWDPGEFRGPIRMTLSTSVSATAPQHQQRRRDSRFKQARGVQTVTDGKIGFDPDQVVKSILAALSGVLTEDIKNHVEFAERQSKALAMQAAWIAEETATGTLSAEDRDWFLKDLARLAENFAREIAALTVLYSREGVECCRRRIMERNQWRC